MTVIQLDAPTFGKKLAARMHEMGFAPDAKIVDVVAHLAALDCEVRWVIGDCNSPGNAELLNEAFNGATCWPCFARRALKRTAG